MERHEEINGCILGKEAEAEKTTLGEGRGRAGSIRGGPQGLPDSTHNEWQRDAAFLLDNRRSWSIGKKAFTPLIKWVWWVAGRSPCGDEPSLHHGAGRLSRGLEAWWCCDVVC
jgi:hypothetical protein